MIEGFAIGGVLLLVIGGIVGLIFLSILAKGMSQ